MPEQLEFGGEINALGRSNFAARTSVRINPSMLILAREARGFTQKDLAVHLGCNQSRLSKIESAELMPQEDDVQNFVKVFQLSREFFFQQGETTPSSVSFFRKAQTLPLKMLRQCYAQMNIRRLQVEQQVGSKKLGKRQLPFLPAEQNGGAEAVAQKLRAEWNLSSGAISCLINLIEDAGCVVVEHSFPSSKLDGVSIRANQKPPIIFLNRDLPKSRRRLSLAHELGHLVMHTNPHEHVEEEAWEFAAEFLAPSAQIGKQLDNLDLDKLGQLKSEWGISMQAILQRAKKLGKISDSYSRFLWIQIAKCGYRVNEPFEDKIPEEKPTELETRMKTTM